VPFLSLLRWIEAGSNYRFLISGLAGLGVVPRGPITLCDVVRTSFFAMVPSTTTWPSSSRIGLDRKRVPARQGSSLAGDSRSRWVAATWRSSRGGRETSSSATQPDSASGGREERASFARGGQCAASRTAVLAFTSSCHSARPHHSCDPGDE
jgi:hypothetical protein